MRHTPRAHATLLPIAIVAVLSLLAACGSDTAIAPTPEPTSVKAQLSTATADGDRIEWASLEGTDTVLWFWAPWCAVCRNEAPAVAEMQRIFGEDVTFVGVAGRDEIGPIRDFIDELDVGGFPHAVDDDGSVWASYEVTTQPSFAFINQDGTTETFVGALGTDGLTERIEALLSA